jgi:outer membrane lipoprotein-sorting protein
MKSKLLLLSAAILFAVEAFAQAPMKKYDIKSGIVTFQTTIKMGSMNMKQKTMVYFDDYGMKECKETYFNDKLTTSYFSDGKNLYLVDHNVKTVTNRGPAYRGTEVRVEWMEFGTEKDRQSGKIKKAPAMTVAGKTCEVFVSDDGKGTVTRYGGWNKVLLYLDVQTPNMKTTIQAVKVQENAKVPAEKFVVPAGYKMQ